MLALVPLVAAALTLGVLTAKLFLHVREQIAASDGLLSYEKLGGDLQWLFAVGLSGGMIVATISVVLSMIDEFAWQYREPSFRRVAAPRAEQIVRNNIIN